MKTCWRRISNAEVGGDFDLRSFAHIPASQTDGRARIEMHLVARGEASCASTFGIDAFLFIAANRSTPREFYKYFSAGVQKKGQLAANAGFKGTRKTSWDRTAAPRGRPFWHDGKPKAAPNADGRAVCDRGARCGFGRVSFTSGPQLRLSWIGGRTAYK